VVVRNSKPDDVIALLVPAPTLAVAGTSGSGVYKNCKALNSYFKHGIGRVGARDHTSGTPVTNFKRSNRLYRLNRGLDRDHDGIACEKR
jgi:Excalibur calcium-binding domain